MVYSLIGYKTLSVTQWVNIFVVFIRNLDHFDAFRLLCGYLFLEAKQEATERSLRLQGHAVREWEGPSVRELRKMVGGRKSIAGMKNVLVDLQLVTISGNRLTVTETPLPESREFLGLICGRDEWGGFSRSLVRPVPIPHAWLFEWTKPVRAKLDPLLHVFYATACLAFKNKTSNEVKVAATFKFERLIAATFLNRSRLTDARRRLIEQDRISPDTTKYQRKLNRDGHYVALNLEWARKESGSISGTHELGRAKEQKCGSTGRPYRDLKQASLVGRDQKGAGASLEALSSIPTASNVQRQDLFSAERLHQLFKKQKWLPKTKANFQFFVMAAVKARTRGEHPERLFVWLVAGGRKDYISLEQEQIAMKEIAELRERVVQTKKRNEGDKPDPVVVDAEEGQEVGEQERLRVRRLIREELEATTNKRAVEVSHGEKVGEDCKSQQAA